MPWAAFAIIAVPQCINPIKGAEIRAFYHQEMLGAINNFMQFHIDFSPYHFQFMESAKFALLPLTGLKMARKILKK